MWKIYTNHLWENLRVAWRSDLSYRLETLEESCIINCIVWGSANCDCNLVRFSCYVVGRMSMKAFENQLLCSSWTDTHLSWISLWKLQVNDCGWFVGFYEPSVGDPRRILRTATWLILPVVIRSSQRLSHACLSINILLWNCERLIISVIVYLIVPYYLDTRSNSRANTCVNTLLG